MPTMKEIAQLAGVSRGTVDRVLNGRGIVNPDTARRVQGIAASLQYKPSQAARNLAARKRNLKLFYIMFSPDSNAFWTQVEAGVHSEEQKLQEYGVTVERLYISSLRDADGQNQLIDEAVAAGADGIVFAGIRLDSTAAKLREIVDSGIPVVTANTDIRGCGRLAYVGSDYFKGGETAAGLLRLITGGEAKVGVLMGSHEVECHEQRVMGFTSRLKETTSAIEVVDICENIDDEFESYRVTSDLLARHPEITALYVASGGVYGAARAIDVIPREKRPLVLCHDCTPSTRALLENGTVAAAICQQPERQGSKPLSLLFNYITMGTVPEQEYFFTDLNIVIRENM